MRMEMKERGSHRDTETQRGTLGKGERRVTEREKDGAHRGTEMRGKCGMACQGSINLCHVAQIHFCHLHQVRKGYALH